MEIKKIKKNYLKNNKLFNIVLTLKLQKCITEMWVSNIELYKSFQYLTIQLFIMS